MPSLPCAILALKSWPCRARPRARGSPRTVPSTRDGELPRSRVELFERATHLLCAELPWGTLDVSRYPQPVVDAARATWTESAFTEYKAVAAFSRVLLALAEAKAPVDLIGMASSFVADEVVHVELASRVAMALGGAMLRPTDFEALYPGADPSLSPLARANERHACERDRRSVQRKDGRRRAPHDDASSHPRGLRADRRRRSASHRLGGLSFEWACERMDDAERARLGDVALRTLESLATTWKRKDEPASAMPRASLEQIHEIGWLESRIYEADVRASVKEAIVAPLASYGIVIPEDAVAALLSSSSCRSR